MKDITVPIEVAEQQLNALTAAVFLIGRQIDESGSSSYDERHSIMHQTEMALGRGLQAIGRDSIYVVQQKVGDRFKDVQGASSLSLAFSRAVDVVQEMRSKQATEAMGAVLDKYGIPRNASLGEASGAILRHNISHELMDAAEQPYKSALDITTLASPKIWMQMQKSAVPKDCLNAWRCMSRAVALRIVERVHSVGRTDLDSRPDLLRRGCGNN